MKIIFLVRMSAGDGYPADDFDALNLFMAIRDEEGSVAMTVFDFAVWVGWPFFPDICIGLRNLMVLEIHVIQRIGLLERGRNRILAAIDLSLFADLVLTSASIIIG